MYFGFSRFWNQFPEATEVQLAKLQVNVGKHVSYCQPLEKPSGQNEMSHCSPMSTPKTKCKFGNYWLRCGKVAVFHIFPVVLQL